MPRRVFLLSPARCSGRRSQQLLGDSRRSALAKDIACGTAGLGETFSFLSGLYFRGKLTYANHFADDPSAGVLIITPTRGLQPAHLPVSAALLREFAAVDIESGDARYRAPFERDAQALRSRIADHTEVVLLGSIATGKYADMLAAIFHHRLVFPPAFVGRGDMSRGALLLRAVREERELEYAAVLGAIRRGPRAPRLEDTP